MQDWHIGFALGGMWLCVGVIVFVVQRDRRRRKQRGGQGETPDSSVAEAKRREDGEREP